MAILNYAQGQDETIVQVILSDFEANTAYVVIVQTGGRLLVDRSVDEILLFGGIDSAAGTDGTVTSNSQGHLTVHHTVGGNFAQEDMAIVTLEAWDAQTVDSGNGATRISVWAGGGPIAAPWRSTQ